MLIGPFVHHRRRHAGVLVLEESAVMSGLVVAPTFVLIHGVLLTPAGRSAARAAHSIAAMARSGGFPSANAALKHCLGSQWSP